MLLLWTFWQWAKCHMASPHSSFDMFDNMTVKGYGNDHLRNIHVSNDTSPALVENTFYWILIFGGKGCYI